MTDAQQREMGEFRAFLKGRGLAVLSLEEDGGAMRVLVPAGQEASLRESLGEWSRARLALWKKLPPPGEGRG